MPVNWTRIGENSDPLTGSICPPGISSCIACGQWRAGVPLRAVDFGLGVVLSAPGFAWGIPYLWGRGLLVQIALILCSLLWFALLIRTTTKAWVKPCNAGLFEIEKAALPGPSDCSFFCGRYRRRRGVWAEHRHCRLRHRLVSDRTDGGLRSNLGNRRPSARGRSAWRARTRTPGVPFSGVDTLSAAGNRLQHVVGTSVGHPSCCRLLRNRGRDRRVCTLAQIPRK